jgi:hypothetical protein
MPDRSSPRCSAVSKSRQSSTGPTSNRRAGAWSLRSEMMEFFMSFRGSLWLNQAMAEFPDIVEAPLRARFVALRVRPEEVDERFILGSGRGGQKIQKTSSCVWLRHRPTGLEVRCQRERSQVANRQMAWTELGQKLEERIRAAASVRKDEQAKSRRRNRQKSHGQKTRMIESKKHRAGIKARRGRPVAE